VHNGGKYGYDDGVLDSKPDYREYLSWLLEGWGIL
jgi:hypothetical protein